MASSKRGGGQGAFGFCAMLDGASTHNATGTTVTTFTPALPERDFAAFLFDMDGTILTSIKAAERVWSDWARSHGLDRWHLGAGAVESGR